MFIIYFIITSFCRNMWGALLLFMWKGKIDLLNLKEPKFRIVNTLVIKVKY